MNVCPIPNRYRDWMCCWHFRSDGIWTLKSISLLCNVLMITLKNTIIWNSVCRKALTVFNKNIAEAINIQLEHMFIWIYLLKMTDTITSQNIDLPPETPRVCVCVFVHNQFNSLFQLCILKGIIHFIIMFICVFLTNRKKESGCIQEEKIVLQEYGIWGKSYTKTRMIYIFNSVILNWMTFRSSSFQCQRIFQVSAPVNCVCLHPNQAELIVGDQSGVIHLWDLRSDHNEQLVCYFIFKNFTFFRI